MNLKSIKRSQEKTGLKVYAKVLGDHGKVYNVGYVRRTGGSAPVRGWLCTCENFIFEKFPKNRNCKHIKFVRMETGRYAASVR